LCSWSPPAPLKVPKVVRLYVPSTQVFDARKVNWASSG